MTSLKSKNNKTEWLELLISCADQADDIALHYYNKVDLSITEKDDKSVVSEGDLAIEKAIRERLQKECPDLEIYGEEFGSCDIKAPLKLIIDPIDGTSNFVRKIPIFGSLLAIELDGEIIVGVVSNPVTKERWYATKGGGAFYNETQINVSKVSSIESAQAFYGSLFGREARGNTEQLMSLLSKTKRQRGIGDFLMHMWVATGYGEFGIDFNLKPWDLAPLGIIVEEAGGQVTAVNGDAFDIYEGSILTSNSMFHDQLVSIYNAVKS